MNQRFIQIDEEGYFSSAGQRLTDEEYGRSLFSALQYDEQRRLRTLDDTIVEFFDEPFVARTISLKNNQLELTLPYGFSAIAPLESLTLDEWDRFHGMTSQNIAFVFNRAAQAQFFELCDDFDDDSFTIGGKTFHPQPWLQGVSENTQPQFWNDLYNAEEPPRFDLHGPAPALVDIIDRLKLSKMRIAVLGAGRGHDAAFFAERGHLVTAFDFSSVAIEDVQRDYGHLKNLTAVQSDVLQIPREYDQQFDLVFEHTCYCAIDPSQRNQLVRAWNRLLTDRGQLLGIFFSMDKIGGPPYGGSEWEVRERLRKKYQFLYWSRVTKSKPTRLGKEFLVLATKISS